MLDLNQLEYAGILIIPLNVAMVEGLKKLGVQNKIAGIIAIIIGMLEGILLFSNGELATGIIIGMSIGLSSVGLFSTGKNIGEINSEQKELKTRK